MAVEEHLEPGEMVLASSGFFYATDRRILRYEPTPLQGPQAESLGYDQVQGLHATVQTRYRLLTVSLVLFVLGLLDPGRTGGVLKLILMIAGLAGIIYSVLARKTAWEVQSGNLAGMAQRRWRIPDEQDERTRRLLQVIRSHMAQEQAREQLSLQEPSQPEVPHNAPEDRP